MGINAAWHSLISIVIIVMHRTHDRLWLTLWTAEEANGGAWNIAVACSCMAGRQGLAKPITWQENILIGPINHAPNGSQSQDPGLTPLDLVHRFGRSGGPMGWSTKGALRGGLHGFQVHRHHPHHSLSICSFREHDLGGFQHFLRIYGMEGGAAEEGEAKTRIS